MKKKIKDLTIGQIVEIAKNNKCNCNGCPLCKLSYPCYDYCNLSNFDKRIYELSLEEEIEVADEKEN